MSPKQQRKFHGIRRGKTRREWVRWLREEVLPAEAREPDRRRPVIENLRVT